MLAPLFTLGLDAAAWPQRPSLAARLAPLGPGIAVGAIIFGLSLPIREALYRDDACEVTRYSIVGATIAATHGILRRRTDGI